jgi:hypothetical protein
MRDTRCSGHIGVDGEQDSGGNDRARERRIIELARELAETINAGEVSDREVLREMAGNVLRDRVQITAPAVPAATPPAGSFNAFGIGIPLILMGAVLVFLFPLVGLLMFAAAAVMLAWGVAMTLFARG